MDFSTILEALKTSEVCFWGILFTIFLIVEVATTALVSVWFVLGSLVAIVLAACGTSFLMQFLCFVVSSFLFFIATRPFVKRMKISHKPMETDLLEGAKGVVILQIDNLRNSGRVTVNGLDWQARSTDGSVLEKDTPVVVNHQENLTLYVSRLTEEVSAE